MAKTAVNSVFLLYLLIGKVDKLLIFPFAC